MSYRTLIGSIAFWAAIGGAQAESQDLRIQGSNTIGAELAPTLAEAWLESQRYELDTVRRNGVEAVIQGKNKAGGSRRIELAAHGSSTGFRGMQSRSADIAMSSRRIKEKELTALAEYGDLRALENEYVIALDGIAIIVHPDNPVEALTKKQVKDIFSGAIKDWKELGGTPGRIQRHARDDASGTFDVFRSLVLGKSTPLADGTTRYEDNGSLSAAVSADTNAIGFTALAFVRAAKPLAISDDGAPPIVPSAFSVATEDYTLSRRLYFYLPGLATQPAARNYAEFATSPAVQSRIENTGFISQAISASAAPAGEHYPKSFFKLTENAQRLSVNIRFEGDSITLDNKAKRDADRVRRYLQENDKMDNGVMLFGFAEKDAELPMMSLELSSRRATQVGKYLRQNGIKVVKTRGYGGAAAVASNTTDQGRQKNRRVEIWVR